MEHQCTKSQVSKYTLRILTLFFTTTFLLSCASTNLVAQTLSSSNKKAIKLYKEAQAFYQSYALDQASSTLKASLEKDPKFVEAQTLLAYVYLDQNKLGEAKEAFKNAIAINPTAIPNNLFFLAELELQEGKYEIAEKLFTQFLNSGKVSPDLNTRANKSLDNIAFALKAKANPFPFEPENMGENINSELSEYFPSITVDGKTLLFTRKLPAPKSPVKFNEDFYIAKKVNGKWEKAQNMKAPINTEINEGAPSLAANGQLMIYAACELFGNYGGGKRGKGSCDLFYSVKNGQVWTKPINLGGNINTGNWESQPSFSADGKSLYFVKGKKSVKGTQDGNIFVTKLTPSGQWTKPSPLNANINTKGNEESVLIHPDGKTLYFSSDGHTGMGGLDIFMSKMDENGEWGVPVNLGYPINTHRNENSLLVSANGNIAFFASDRAGGYGELDLYSFDLPKEFAPNKVSYFAGKIYDKKTQKPLAARFELIDLDDEKVVVEAFSDKVTGEFLVTLPTGKNYALNASKSGYLFYSENFSLKDYNDDKPFIQNVPLSPIEVGEKIVLKNIFFETGKFNLKEESKVELRKLVAFLEKNVNLKIEIGGHTDNVGSDASNLTLSKNRAKAVSDFLIQANISASRLTSTGYGASKPIADNTTKEGRAKNRRTEFQITGL